MGSHSHAEIEKNDIERASVEALPPPKVMRHTRIGNPGSLGLFCFASTTFMLSMYNIQTRSITHPNVVVGMAVWCGGLAQILAGMWEFPRGNVFGGTAFTSYGTFWMSYATILIPGSGIVAAYGDDGKAEFASAVGIFLLTWAMFTAILCVTSLGKNWGFVSLFGLLTITFVTLACGEFGANAKATKAGGVMGVIVAFIAYYIGISEFMNAEENPPFRLPIGIIHKKSN